MTHAPAPAQPDTREIRRIYRGMARWYDLVTLLSERFLLRGRRRRTFGGARGRVLEVAVGTGINLRHLRPDAEITAVDLSLDMLERARGRARRARRRVDLLVADAGVLPFDDATFDAVTTSLSMCTFPEPTAAIREMARVCRPGGRLHFLEHGRSSAPWLARLQERWAPGHLARHACHLTRDPLELVRGAGLRVVEERRGLMGVVYEIVAEA